MSIKSLDKELTPLATAWNAFVNKEFKTKPADNPDQYVLIGRTLLDKEEFNRVNDGDHAILHGWAVYYVFNSKQALQEFVADYDLDWPGNQDFRFIKVGQVDMISTLHPKNIDVVHNKSQDFQAQLMLSKQREKIEEIESTKRALEKRALEKPHEMTSTELELQVKWQKNTIEQAEKQLEQLKKHLSYLESLKLKVNSGQSSTSSAQVNTSS